MSVSEHRPVANGRATPSNGKPASPPKEFPSLRGQVGQSSGTGPRIGVVQSFRPGEYDAVDDVLTDLAGLGVADLRTAISWADLQTAEGEEWYEWLIPRLAAKVNLVPCVL